MKLSVVVPSLGNVNNLSRLFDSLENQKVSDGDQFDVVVVLNGTEKTAVHEFENLKNKFSKLSLTFFWLPQSGVNRARNFGMNNVSSELVLFMDDDCLAVGSDFIEQHLKAHKNDENIFAYGGDYLPPIKSLLADRIYNHIQMGWFNDAREANSKKMRYLLGGNFSIKSGERKLHNISFDEYIKYGGSELDFFIMATKRGLQFQYINAPVEHATNVSISSLFSKVYKQGRGKSYLDRKYSSMGGESKLDLSDLNFGDRFIVELLSWSFWLGYYQANRNLLSWFLRFIKVSAGRLNRIRYGVLDKLKGL